MRPVDPVIAICCSDLHLSHNAPLCRTAEPNWYQAQHRMLGEIHSYVELHECPLIIAGDLFDKPENPPELVNFVLSYLPPCYAIPGNHDLKHHSYENVHKSSYWTLVEAGRVHNLEPGERIETMQQVYSENHLYLYGFPPGFTPVELSDDRRPYGVHIAVVHDYIWTKGKGYTGASPSSHVSHEQWDGKLAGYSAAVFGDNHQGFSDIHSDPVIVNCGTTNRRKSDERDYKPSVWLLYEHGHVERKYLTTDKDKFTDLEPELRALESALDIDDLLVTLSDLWDKVRDFGTVVKRFLKKHQVSGPTKQIILEALAKARERR